MDKVELLKKNGKVKVNTFRECLDIIDKTEEKYGVECMITKMKKSIFDSYVVEVIKS